MVKVYSIDQDGKKACYCSVKEAARTLFCSYETIIRRSSDGRPFQSNGKLVRVDFEELDSFDPEQDFDDCYPVMVFGSEGQFMAQYPSLRTASKATKTDARTIRRHIDNGLPIRTSGLMFDYAC